MTGVFVQRVGGSGLTDRSNLFAERLRRDAGEPRETQPMPRMRNTLTFADVRRVRFADPERQ